MIPNNEKARRPAGSLDFAIDCKNQRCNRSAELLSVQAEDCVLLTEYVVDLAMDFGLCTAVDRNRTWLLSKGLSVCWHDRIRLGAEPGCVAVALHAIDGIGRATDRRAPIVLIQEGRVDLMCRPSGTNLGQRRIGLYDLGALLGIMAEAVRVSASGRRDAR